MGHKQPPLQPHWGKLKGPQVLWRSCFKSCPFSDLVPQSCEHTILPCHLGHFFSKEGPSLQAQLDPQQWLRAMGHSHSRGQFTSHGIWNDDSNLSCLWLCPGKVTSEPPHTLLTPGCQGCNICLIHVLNYKEDGEGILKKWELIRFLRSHHFRDILFQQELSYCTSVLLSIRGFLGFYFPFLTFVSFLCFCIKGVYGCRHFGAEWTFFWVQQVYGDLFLFSHMYSLQ